MDDEHILTSDVLVDLDKDQVLVFQRDEDGSRTVEALDPDRLTRFRDEFQLGELWYNRGEEGLTQKKQ